MKKTRTYQCFEAPPRCTNAWIRMIVVHWIFSHPKSKIIQHLFDLFTACFCDCTNQCRKYSVNLDAAVEPASVSLRRQHKWVRLSSFTYFPKEISPLILKLNFNDTTVKTKRTTLRKSMKLFLELSDESFRFAFINALICFRLNQSETFDLLTSFCSKAGHAQSTCKSWFVSVVVQFCPWFKFYFISYLFVFNFLVWQRTVN